MAYVDKLKGEEVNSVRYGRRIVPTWTDGTEVTAPAANSNLVSVSVPTGKTGLIYGFYITAQEANDFKITWTSGAVARSKRIVFGSAGTTFFDSPTALNEGAAADAGTSITIQNVNAGAAGKIYQAGLLIGTI